MGVPQLLASCLLTTLPICAAEPAAKIELNEDNYAAWRKHIVPEAGELAWTKIPWLTTFKDGLVAADRAGKPLLFWTMNGHPLGCT